MQENSQPGEAKKDIFTLIEQEPNAPVLVFQINGVDMICPFSPLTPIQTSRGQAFGRSNCNTGCPLTRIYREPRVEGQVIIFSVHCGCKPVEHEVDIVHASNLQKVAPSPIVRL